MVKQYREEYLKYAKYIEDHYEGGTKEYENLRAYLNIIDLGIKAIEEDLLSPEKRNLQIATIRANFKILREKMI